MRTRVTRLSALPRRADLDALLLDAGGVLVNPDWGRIAEVLRDHGVTLPPQDLSRAEAAAKRRLDRREQMEATTDEMRAARYFGLVLSAAGWPGSVPDEAWRGIQAEHARRNLWRVVLPGTREALTRLRESGLRLGLVSNANGTVEQLFSELGLAPYFDTLLDSFVEGVEKPDPRIFERALARLGTSADRALHVGDFYYLDVVGARAAGVAAALIDVGDLYAEFDCPRFRSLPELVDALLA